MLSMSGITLLRRDVLDSEGRVRFNPVSTATCAGADPVMRIDERGFIVAYVRLCARGQPRGNEQKAMPLKSFRMPRRSTSALLDAEQRTKKS
ncbi:hypothetical protein D918_09401 [Trichuris suis]|nr:hypothetical protein D918_09401 [Trichuris suis]